MAKRVVTFDDLDGSEAAESIVYGIDGEFWEIDLSEKNAKVLRDSLTKYIKVSRSTTPPKVRRSSAAAGNGQSQGDFDPAEVRAWASAQGIEVSEKGRIPDSVVAQWRRAASNTASA